MRQDWPVTFAFCLPAIAFLLHAMSYPADYHLHTPLCRHATGEPDEFAARALEIGLSEIGFSDHSPMRRDDFDNWRMRYDELGAYVETITRTRLDHPALSIKLALEVDYLPGYEDWIRDLAARHPWDYLIGSVHYVSDAWVVDDPARRAEWNHHDVDEVWSIYFERLTMAADSKLFDIIGHADLPKKFGLLPRGDSRSLWKRFLDAATRNRVAVELNTAGLRKECREIYPSPEFVRLMFEHRIPITFGSDAHAVGEVGAHLADAMRQARQAGYTTWSRFTQRQSEAVAF